MLILCAIVWPSPFLVPYIVGESILFWIEGEGRQGGQGGMMPLERMMRQAGVKEVGRTKPEWGYDMKG